MEHGGKTTFDDPESAEFIQPKARGERIDTRENAENENGAYRDDNETSRKVR